MLAFAIYANMQKKVTGQSLYAVVGGFHLTEKDQNAVDATIEYFKLRM